MYLIKMQWFIDTERWINEWPVLVLWPCDHPDTLIHSVVCLGAANMVIRLSRSVFDGFALMSWISLQCYSWPFTNDSGQFSNNLFPKSDEKRSSVWPDISPDSTNVNVQQQSNTISISFKAIPPLFTPPYDSRSCHWIPVLLPLKVSQRRREALASSSLFCNA